MQIKKTDWINKPEKVITRAHSLRFTTDKRTIVLYTLEEEGNLKLIRHSKSTSFVMLHTKEDRIIFSDNCIDVKFFGLKERISKETGDILQIEKKKNMITFSSENEVLLEISAPPFSSSASFGFLVEPSEEEIILEFF